MGLYLYTVNYFSISLGHDFFSHKGHLWLGIQGWLFGWVMLKKNIGRISRPTWDDDPEVRSGGTGVPVYDDCLVARRLGHSSINWRHSFIMKNLWSVDLYFWAHSNSDSCSLYRSPDWNTTQHDKHIWIIYMRRNMISSFYWDLPGNVTNRWWWRHKWYQPCWGASQLRLIQEEYLRPSSRRRFDRRWLLLARCWCFCPALCPTHDASCGWFRTPLAGCGAHAGRCCPATTALRWVAGSRMRATLIAGAASYTFLANASWCQDVWQRDDALRCSLGVPGILGQHVVRGGQTLRFCYQRGWTYFAICDSFFVGELIII